MKCLPQNKIVLTNGSTLFDWHAEILAIRSFNRFLMEECLTLLHNTNSSKATVKDENGCSKYLRFRTKEEITESHFQPFSLKENIILHMFCSEAPCGDASMELIMAAQMDSTPWEIPHLSSSSHENQSSPARLHGRSYFSNLGTIRRKPSRPDAPPSLSKSCSDKLALKQSTSLLSSITSLLISPENVYITYLIIPASQYSKNACDRAFSVTSGRLKALQERVSDQSYLLGGYRLKPFSIYPTSLEFEFSRRQPLRSNESLSASNIASFSTPRGSGTLIGGTLQGRKQFSRQGAPPMCKRQMWQLALEVARLMANKPLVALLTCGSGITDLTYGELKCADLLCPRRKVKRDVRHILGMNEGMVGWERNVGGEDWIL